MKDKNLRLNLLILLSLLGLNFNTYALPVADAGHDVPQAVLWKILFGISSPEADEYTAESYVIEVTAQNYEQEVLNSDIPVIVDVYGAWCTTCTLLRVMYQKVSADFVGKIKFVAIESPKFPEFSSQFNIAKIPALLLFDHGTCVHMHEGFIKQVDFIAMLQEYLAK